MPVKSGAEILGAFHICSAGSCTNTAGPALPRRRPSLGDAWVDNVEHFLWWLSSSLSDTRLKLLTRRQVLHRIAVPSLWLNYPCELAERSGRRSRKRTRVLVPLCKHQEKVTGCPMHLFPLEKGKPGQWENASSLVSRLICVVNRSSPLTRNVDYCYSKIPGSTLLIWRSKTFQRDAWINSRHSHQSLGSIWVISFAFWLMLRIC